ncbi:endonuclease/exonuclease/phosphatase family protein [Winogradskyella sp.]|uniref:endonuclease/exonuclease/phosphatase family protein n=1 Tax=Winogradskyella sp. TaxID=1883156 RepID=UPI00260FEA42|nr:endonuclease/exonuclease/phosphatase family protein [Winogradskyella sp.]
MDYHITFWNLENLFDVEDSPRRTDKVQRAIGSDIKGWDQTELDRKLRQLSSIIVQLNNGQGPDILGVCEIENSHVLNLLKDSIDSLGRNYAIVHDDSDDRRGIDVAFIYDADLFTVEEEQGENKIFGHFVMRRTATRDILQVNFLTKHSQEQQRLVLIANHWPSRSGGQYESNGYRQIAGETLSYFHERIRDIYGDDTPVLAMGDFNDEPFNESLTRFALSLRSRTRVVRGNIPYFLNLMWPLMDEGVGTFYFNNLPNMLDQFLANENMLKSNSPIQVLRDTVTINNFPEMVKKGNYPVPKHYGGMGKKIQDYDNDFGYSDHYPISVKLRE